MTKTAAQLTPGDKVWGAIVTATPQIVESRVEVQAVYAGISNDLVWHERTVVLAFSTHQNVTTED